MAPKTFSFTPLPQIKEKYQFPETLHLTVREPIPITDNCFEIRTVKSTELLIPQTHLFCGLQFPIDPLILDFLILTKLSPCEIESKFFHNVYRIIRRNATAEDEGKISARRILEIYDLVVLAGGTKIMSLVLKNNNDASLSLGLECSPNGIDWGSVTAHQALHPVIICGDWTPKAYALVCRMRRVHYEKRKDRFFDLEESELTSGKKHKPDPGSAQEICNEIIDYTGSLLGNESRDTVFQLLTGIIPRCDVQYSYDLPLFENLQEAVHSQYKSLASLTAVYDRVLRRIDDMTSELNRNAASTSEIRSLKEALERERSRNDELMQENAKLRRDYNNSETELGIQKSLVAEKERQLRIQEMIAKPELEKPSAPSCSSSQSYSPDEFYLERM